jgi:Tfp pilus assembly protein PilW
VTIAASLVLVVISAVLSMLDSFTRAEHHLDERSDATGSREMALGEFTRDLRAAGRLDASPTAPDLRTEIIAEVTGDSGERTIRWSIDPTGTLERQVQDSAPSTPELREVVTGLDADASRFRYFDAEGRELVPGVQVPDEVLRCAARVELELVSAERAGGELGSSSATVAMRNREVAAGC